MQRSLLCYSWARSQLWENNYFTNTSPFDLWGILDIFLNFGLHLIFYSNSWSFNYLVIKHSVLEFLSCISNDYALVFLKIDSMWSLIEYRNIITLCWFWILHPRQTAIIGANSLSFFMLIILHPYPVYLPCSVQGFHTWNTVCRRSQDIHHLRAMFGTQHYTVRVQLTTSRLTPGDPLEEKKALGIPAFWIITVISVSLTIAVFFHSRILPWKKKSQQCISQLLNIAPCCAVNWMTFFPHVWPCCKCIYSVKETLILIVKFTES